MQGTKSNKTKSDPWDIFAYENEPPVHLSKKNRALWRKWNASEYRCTGTTKNGEPCTKFCKMDWDHRDEFWPGVTDRCHNHIDEVARRTRDMARIAQRSGADLVESLQPSERKKRMSNRQRSAKATCLSRKPTRPVANRLTTPSIDRRAVAKLAAGDNVDDDPARTEEMLRGGWQSWLPLTFDD